MSVRVEYGGVAVGAKNNFVPTTEDKAYFVDLSELQEDISTHKNYGNPCELYSVLLDGNTLGVPDNTAEEKLGLWSEQITNADGFFETPVEVTFKSENYFTSSGISLTFDTYNNIFATNINIKWYQADKIVSDKDFQPDKPFYFCMNKVEYYNKVVITFKSLNMPYNRLKLRSIEYGMRLTFYDDEIRKAKIIQEIDPLSTKISINTCDFTLDSKKNIEFSFEERQPISVYFNDELRSTTFVKSAKRKSKNIWNIQGEDYIGLMDTVPYYGGIYSNKNAVELITDIFSVAKIPFVIDESFSGEFVSGYIPYTTCRDALMQVVFAIDAVVDTSNSDKVKIYALSDEITQTISLNRILQGQNFDDETRMTAVEVTAHSYKPIQEKVTIYDAKESGTGDNIFVKFNEPLHNLTITNGVILSSGNNYAIITANENCILDGLKHEHTTIIKRKNNPFVLSSDVENVISVQNATLVSFNNIDRIVEKCYDYYENTGVINLSIIEGKHEVKTEKSIYGIATYGLSTYMGYAKSSRSVVKDQITEVGQVIDVETEYLGVNQGRILRQSYNLNGGILIKDTILKRSV